MVVVGLVPLSKEVWELSSHLLRNDLCQFCSRYLVFASRRHSKRETRKKTNEMALGKNRMLQLSAIIMVEGHSFESMKQTNNTKAESKQIDPHSVSRRHARL